MAFSIIHSAQLAGLGAVGVVVETDISRGLYLFQIVGLPNKAVEEARERVISALRNSLDVNPKALNQKVVVSMSPAELKKEGSYFDVAIALGYLTASEALKFEGAGKLFVGELGLNGDIRPVRGLLSIAQWAKKNNIEELYIPKGNEDEARLIEGVKFFLMPTLFDLVQHLLQQKLLDTISHLVTTPSKEPAIPEIDFADVKGQQLAKRALTIAASGGHNVVLYGPPGTGKTMLAKAFHGILPPLTKEEFLEVATIYSSIGLIGQVIDGMPPLRAPHHSASHVAILGGGASVRPGDITLAHRGVLFMDEFSEFDRRTIEALREPLEEGSITIARARGSMHFPAQFILLAAMNPCACGYSGSTAKDCICTASEIIRYNKRLSGPIIDRIDLWVPVQHIEYESLHHSGDANESAVIRETVKATRVVQRERGGSDSRLSTSAKDILQQFAEKIKLSPRSYLKTIKVARTIADLDHSETIEERHILEALQYRPKIE